MLAAKRSVGVTPEANIREHILCTPLPSVNKAAHSGFEIQRRHHQISKTGVSVTPQKGLMSSKKIFKKVYARIPVTLLSNEVSHGTLDDEFVRSTDDGRQFFQKT